MCVSAHLETLNTHTFWALQSQRALPWQPRQPLHHALLPTELNMVTVARRQSQGCGGLTVHYVMLLWTRGNWYVCVIRLLQPHGVFMFVADEVSQLLIQDRLSCLVASLMFQVQSGLQRTRLKDRKATWNPGNVSTPLETRSYKVIHPSTLVDAPTSLWRLSSWSRTLQHVFWQKPGKEIIFLLLIPCNFKIIIGSNLPPSRFELN